MSISTQLINHFIDDFYTCAKCSENSNLSNIHFPCSVCFIAFKMALDSKRANLTSIGLNGMHVRI